MTVLLPKKSPQRYDQNLGAFIGQASGACDNILYVDQPSGTVRFHILSKPHARYCYCKWFNCINSFRDIGPHSCLLFPYTCVMMPITDTCSANNCNNSWQMFVSLFLCQHSLYTWALTLGKPMSQGQWGLMNRCMDPFFNHTIKI